MNKSQIPYMVIGGQAVLLYGEARLTKDIDITLGAGVDHLDKRVKFASLEDVIIHKMIAGRPRDIEDIQAIVLKNPGYDSPYIEKWLSEFDTALDKDDKKSFAELIKKLK